MGLPVPADYPVLSFSQYDSHNPPVIPQIRTSPETQHVVAMVASAVANEATNKANMHAGRTFFYNLISNNYWNNPFYQEIVQLISDMVTVNLRKGFIRSPEQGIQDAAVQGIGAYVSSLFYAHPELKSMVSPQVLDAALQNIPFFNNLKQEISSMSFHNPGFNMPMNGYPGQPMGGPAPMMNHGYPNQGQFPGHQQMHPQQFHGGYPNQGYPSPPVGFHGNTNYPPQERQGGAFANPGNSRFQEAPANSMPADRFGGRAIPQPQPQAVQHFQQPIAEAAPVVKREQKALLIEKGSEMERSQHQITFFGESYAPNMQARSKQFASSVSDLVQTVAVEDDNTNLCLDINVTLDLSIERAILTGQMKQFEHQRENSSINVFRCFTIVTQPMLCTEDVNGYLESLRESSSFPMLVVKLKSLAMSLSIRKDSVKETDSVISFLKRFDNLLTKIVNDFLRNNLQLKTRIESFTDDVSSLGDYLQSKFGANYNQAFMQFESEVIETILESIEPDIAAEFVQDLVIPEGLYYGLTPVNHSFTFVCMNDKELGYKLTDKPLIIDPDTAPSLYRIAASLDDHKKQMGMSTIYDILVTADGAQYKLYKNYLRSNQYLIDRA